jgi:hypothetical protein
VVTYQPRASRTARLAGSVRQVRRSSHTGRRGTAGGPRCSPGRSRHAQTGGYARRCAPARLRRAGDHSCAHLLISLGTALASAVAGSFAPSCRGVLLPPVRNGLPDGQRHDHLPDHVPACDRHRHPPAEYRSDRSGQVNPRLQFRRGSGRRRGRSDAVNCIWECTLDTLLACLLRRLGSLWRTRTRSAWPAW